MEVAAAKPNKTNIQSPNKLERTQLYNVQKPTKKPNKWLYPFGDSSLRTFDKKRYRYCGKEKDAESGLYYYGARYYTAWTCRFISVDPLALKYVFQTPYAYADNNPIDFLCANR